MGWVQSKGKKWLYPQNMEAPNKQCFICQKSQIHLTLNPKLFNYGAFVKQILIKSLGFKQPDITIEYIEKDDVNKTGSNYLESITENDDEEERKEKELALSKDLNHPQIKIYDAASLCVEDFSQDVNVKLIVHHLDLDQEEHTNGFEISNNWTLNKFKLNSNKKEETSKQQNGNKYIGKKRKEMDLDEAEGESKQNQIEQQPPNKKLKTTH